MKISYMAIFRTEVGTALQVKVRSSEVEGVGSAAGLGGRTPSPADTPNLHIIISLVRLSKTIVKDDVGIVVVRLYVEGVGSGIGLELGPGLQGQDGSKDDSARIGLLQARMIRLCVELGLGLGLGLES